MYFPGLHCTHPATIWGLLLRQLRLGQVFLKHLRVGPQIICNLLRIGSIDASAPVNGSHAGTYPVFLIHEVQQRKPKLIKKLRILFS